MERHPQADAVVTQQQHALRNLTCHQSRPVSPPGLVEQFHTVGFARSHARANNEALGLNNGETLL
jgi:hypothetical protein